MTDYFAVLGQPRRPWLDPDQLKQRYQELTFALHPDRQEPDAEQGDFAAVTEAYRVLSTPRLRVRHLLSLDVSGDEVSLTKTSNVPNDLADIFIEAAGLVQQIDAHRQKQEQTTSALGKSLLSAETGQLQSRANAMLMGLDDTYETALKDLRRLDETWVSDPSSVTNELRALADRFGYLERWMTQLREKQFQLST